MNMVAYEKWANGLTLDDLVRMEMSSGVFGEYSKLKYLERAPGHVKAQLARARRFPHNSIFAARQGFPSMETQDPNSSNFAAVGGSSTAEVNLWTAVTTWSGIPAQDMRAGKKYTLRAGGLLGTSGTPTITFTPRIGTSTTPASNISFGGSGALTGPNTVNGAPWLAEFHMIVRSIGLAAAGTTCTGHGVAFMYNGTSPAVVCVMGTGVPTTVDSTIQQALILSITFGTSNASNTFTTQWVAMRSDN